MMRLRLYRQDINFAQPKALQTGKVMKRFVMIGGGHAHLSVLEKFARQPVVGVERILITPNRYQNYSGMLPGWISGHYTREQSRIDLQPLVQAAGVKMINVSLINMDADQRMLFLSDGSSLTYDLLSMDVGSETQTDGLEGLGERLLPVKPLDDFFEKWPSIRKRALASKAFSLVIVGGGAAGVELALAAQYALRLEGASSPVTLIVSPDGLLRGHHISVRRRVEHYLEQASLILLEQAARGVSDGLLLSDGRFIPADQVIAATGAKPLPWLRTSGLALDEQGYILVDAHHRTQSHPEVFAAGDTCARMDVQMARSGVHAVKAGPVLAENVYAVLTDFPGTTERLKSYHPRASSLYLLACGPRYAIASWGRWSFQGKWVWYLKNWIDRGFIRRFSLSTGAHSA